jgi:hypothetical protein
MKKSPSIISQDSKPRSWSSGVNEREQIKAELLIKYQQEFSQATWWKKMVIRIRISREASRILGNRLYSKSDKSRHAEPAGPNSRDAAAKP